MINGAMSFSYVIPESHPNSFGFCILAIRRDPSLPSHHELEVGCCITHLPKVDGVVVCASHRTALPRRRFR